MLKNDIRQTQKSPEINSGFLEKEEMMESCVVDRFTVCVFAFVAFSFATSPFAQEFSASDIPEEVMPFGASGIPEEVLKGRSVIAEKHLQPRSDTEVLIPKMKVQILSDGTEVISGSGTSRANEPPEAFGFEVDFQSGTYTTWRVDPSQLKSPNVQEKRTKKFLPEETDFEKAPTVDRQSKGSGNLWDMNVLGSLWNLLVPNAWAAPILWQGSISVFAVEPALQVVAQTDSKLLWIADSSANSISIYGLIDICGAANPVPLPPPFNTHWFIENCNFNEPWIQPIFWEPGAPDEIWHLHGGQYFNWDFGFQDQRTDVNHWSFMGARVNGSFHWGWGHSDYGEAAELIAGFVCRNCF